MDKITIKRKNDCQNNFCHIDQIKLFMSWNSYPSYTHHSIIKRLRNNTNTYGNEKTNDQNKIIWIRSPYLGQVGEEMKKHCF